MIGLGYTLCGYRNMKLYSMITVGILEKIMRKGLRGYGETHEVNVMNKKDTYCYDTVVGRSHKICIY